MGELLNLIGGIFYPDHTVLNVLEMMSFIVHLLLLANWFLITHNSTVTAQWSSPIFHKERLERRCMQLTSLGK